MKAPAFGRFPAPRRGEGNQVHGLGIGRFRAPRRGEGNQVTGFGPFWAVSKPPSEERETRSPVSARFGLFRPGKALPRKLAGNGHFHEKK